MTALRVLGVLTIAVAFEPAIMGVVQHARSADNKPKIGIVYTQPHPVINDIIAGFKSTVTEAYPNASFFERHAEGRPEQYGTAVLSSISAQPDILAPITTPITKLAVEQARGRIPIVFMGVTDPVGAGVAQSLDAPGIATGSSDLCPFAGLLAVVRQVLPAAKTLGLPYNPTDEPAVFGRTQLLKLAPRFGFSISDQQVTSPSELSTQVRGLATRVDAVIIGADNLMMENPAAVASAALESGKPTFACDTASVQAGAVAGVSVSYKEVGVLAGQLAIKVLGGEPAGKLPVAVLGEGGIAANTEAACRDRVTIPVGVLAKATDLAPPNFKCPRAPQ
jgi:putative ABC transport system substrate-binding protein